MIELKDENAVIPNEFLCSISRDIMNDPVMCTDGQTYERLYIEAWLKNSVKSPLYNITLESKTLIPNYALRNAIENFIKKSNEEFDARGKKAHKNIENSDFRFAAKEFCNEFEDFVFDSKVTLSDVEYDRDQLLDWNHIAEAQKKQLADQLQEREAYMRKLKQQANNIPNDKKIQFEKDLSQINVKLKIDPNNTKFISIKVDLLKKLQRQTEALELLNQTLKKEPNNTFLLTARATTFKDEGRLSKALEDFNKVLSLEPANSWALSGKKAIREILEKYGNDELCSEKSVEISFDPNFGLNSPIKDAKQLSQEAKQLKLGGKLNEALFLLDEGISVEPKNIFLLCQRGDIYYKLGQTKKALADFDRVLEICPDNKYALAGKQQMRDQKLPEKAFSNSGPKIEKTNLMKDSKNMRFFKPDENKNPGEGKKRLKPPRKKPPQSLG